MLFMPQQEDKAGEKEPVTKEYMAKGMSEPGQRGVNAKENLARGCADHGKSTSPKPEPTANFPRAMFETKFLGEKVAL